MPNKDGTGPQGKGAKTGRGTGNCKDAESSQNGFRRNSCIGPRRCSRGSEKRQNV